MKQHLWSLVIGGCCLSPVPMSAGITVYRIGNSLTWQSSPAGIKNLLAQRGFTGTTSGNHVNCGSSLINTWNNPNQTCVTPSPSVFSTALPGNAWSAITAQPFAGTGSTLGTDADVISNLALLMRNNAANAGTPVYVFATHPYSSSTASYQQQWTKSVTTSGDSEPTAATREYSSRLYTRLEPLFPAQKISMIPAGEILYELDVRMRAGQVSGYSDIYQLYFNDNPGGDLIHLNNEGDYLEGCATFAALTGQDPWGMTAPADYGTVNLNAGQYNAFHDALWYVIRHDPNCRPLWYSNNWPNKINRITHFHDAIVRTNGTLVEAVNLGSAANVTVNGVIFTGALTRDGLTSAYNDPGVYSDGGVSSDFETLLDSFASVQGATNPSSGNLVLTGLTPGLRYEVQFFVADERNPVTRSRTVQFEIQGKSIFYAQEGMGFSVTGAFIATGTTEVVTIRATMGTGDSFQGAPMLNAFQVRQASVPAPDPEPGSAPMATTRTWTGGGADNNWTTVANWLGSMAPATGNAVVFDSYSTARLSNTLAQNHSLAGVRIVDPPAAVTLNGNTLTLGSEGVQLDPATQNAGIHSNVTLGASQTWTVAAGRTLMIGSAPSAQQVIFGGNALTVAGAGNTVLNPYGASQAGILIKTGTGQLTLTSNLRLHNSNVNIQGGVLSVQAAQLYDAFYSASGAITISGGGVLELQNWHYHAQANLGYLRANNDAIVVNGGTIRMNNGGIATSYFRGFTVNAGGASLEANGTALWTLGFASTTACVYNSNPSLTFTGTGLGQFDKVFSGSGALTKNGTGTWMLTGENTHSGTTTVNDGILAVSGNSIPNTGKLVINGGKVAPTGTEIVGTLFFGTTQKTVGTWGATDSGADYIDDLHFSGTAGKVNVTTAPPNTYALWIAGFPGAAGAPGFKQDADNDGISNGVEHILGTNPSVASVGLTQVSATTNSVTFSHTQTNSPATDVTKSYEWSTDLIEWKPGGIANVGGTIGTIVATTVTDNATPANDVIQVVVTATGTPASKLFARLVANQ